MGCTAVLFRKKKKHGVPSHVRTTSGGAPDAPAFYHITFESMLKGSVVSRRGKEVRQFGLSYKGSVRLITSGDTVDRETYEALLAAGAVRSLEMERTEDTAEAPPIDAQAPMPSAAGSEE